MLVRAGDRDLGWMAAEVAVLVTERGLGGNDADLTQRLQRWRRETGKRAEASRALVKRWTGLVSRNSAHRGNDDTRDIGRSEEHTSELQSLMRISYAVFCLKKKIKKTTNNQLTTT